MEISSIFAYAIVHNLSGYDSAQPVAKQIPFKTFIPDEHENAIDEIKRGFGSKYMLTFC